jgi:CRISPR type III-B/RAMP module RAMP protein Cmr1
MQFTLKALTDIWTGGVDRKAGQFHATGLRGSIRWWYETLIRGLGVYACDPHSADRCLLSAEHAHEIVHPTSSVKIAICPACYIFGCTGWSSKVTFRATAVRAGVQYIQTEQIKAGDVFTISLVERKRVEAAEHQLLQMMFRIIVDYAAIGGRTTFKPSEIPAKNGKAHHADYGVVTRGPKSNVPQESLPREDINAFLSRFSTDKTNHDDWPDLRNFWFVKGKHLDRMQINGIVGRNAGGVYSSPSEFPVFLGGFISREKNSFVKAIRDQYTDANAASKKLFSFHGLVAGRTDRAVERCFGYTRNVRELATITAQVTSGAPSLTAKDILRGDDLLKTF